MLRPVAGAAIDLGAYEDGRLEPCVVRRIQARPGGSFRVRYQAATSLGTVKSRTLPELGVSAAQSSRSKATTSVAHVG